MRIWDDVTRTTLRAAQSSSPRASGIHGRRDTRRIRTVVRLPGASTVRTYKFLISLNLTPIGVKRTPSCTECAEIHVYLPPSRVKVAKNSEIDDMNSLTTVRVDDQHFEAVYEQY